MDAAARAALRLASGVDLAEARRTLQAAVEALTEQQAGLDALTRTLDALQADRTRWEQGRRSLVGHTLTAAEVRAVQVLGESIEDRARRAAGSHAIARAAVREASRTIEGARRRVGELLARQRWLDDDAGRAREADDRRTALREDEE